MAGEMSGGFEGLVIQELGNLRDDVGKLATQVGGLNMSVVQLNEHQKQADERQTKLAGPLVDWTATDSFALKALIDREKSRVQRNQEAGANRSAWDTKVRSLRERVVLIGAITGLLTGFGLGMGEVANGLRHLITTGHW